MRKSTQLVLVMGLALSAIAIVLYAAVLGVGYLLMDVLDPDVATAISLGLGYALIPAFVISVIAYARRAAHKSWKVNTSRYPGVGAAIDRYLDNKEDVRRVLPAFLLNGARYFLVKYVRKNEQWAPEGETGMVVVDDQGRVQSDEDLFRRLLIRVRYVEDAYQGLRGQEDVMAAGPQMEREIAEAKSFFADSAFSNADPEWLEALEAFWGPLNDHVQRMAALMKGEYQWSNKHRTQVEFTLEEMMPLVAAREEASAWLMENAAKIAQAWAKVEKQRQKLENLPGLLPGRRARLRRLMSAFHTAAKATSDADNFKIQVSPKRIEAYRARTAKALRLDGEAPRSANVR